MTERPSPDPTHGAARPAVRPGETRHGPAPARPAAPSGTERATPGSDAQAPPAGSGNTRGRTPNRRLAALIAEAGFSNAGLARRVDQLGLEHGLDLRYDKTSVTRWLRGQQPRGTTPALIAEVFSRRLGRRLTAQDLGLDTWVPVYAGLEFAATPSEAVDIVSGLWRKDTGNHADLRKIAFTAAGLVVPSRDWLIGRADERVARIPEQAGPHGSPAPGSGTPPPAPSRNPLPRQQQTERAPGEKVTASDIAALRTVGTLFRNLDQVYGGGHARQALVRYLEHELEPMLRGTYGDTTGRGLFAAAADLTRLAGWTSYDIAAHGLAQRYFVQALRLAQAAGDRMYGAYVLSTMSRQAVYLGHGREAVQLARVAQQGVGSAAPPAVLALLHAVEARGHGVLGDVRACTASLLRAEQALETARTGDDLPFWARFFDEGQLADEFGHCHRDLQQYRTAARHAERSLDLRSPDHVRSRLFCRVVLATALLGLGELERACSVGAEAARAADGMRSARAADYVREFERRLELYKDSAAVRGYRERVGGGGRRS
ncbi:regulator [Streptomyces meridianus]|uniref:Regulator n=1 Tax=Streptomyces meridianus TaxID=2938945 RepID=A0ABT0X1D3_9ACTN|nr:regulator [Streptomyces meridianus]MCM2576369.1 regulator [Streptomyces meridianus]